MTVTVASGTAGQSSFLMNFILLFSLIFTGFLVNVNSIPDWISWIHYLSVFYYAFEAMMTTELSGMKLTFIYTPVRTTGKKDSWMEMNMSLFVLKRRIS
jgi:ABC-type multidrug transport system permease subunit